MDQKLLKAAIEALNIDVPIYSAIVNKQGEVEIWTRNGKYAWNPPKVKPKSPPSRKRKKGTDEE